MIRRRSAFVLLHAACFALLAVAPAACGQTFAVEPDAFADDAVLNDVSPAVELRVFDGFLQPNFPVDFGVFPDPDVIPITAVTNPDIFGGFLTSTGTKSFAHAGVNFFNETAQLAMRFPTAASSVSIDVIGTSDLSSTVGRLEVYSSGGQFLQSVSSGQLFRQGVGTLTISRPAGDIGFARAFSDPGFSPFGAFDNLRFDLSAPAVPGDFNGDGDVDAGDWNTWRVGFAASSLGDTDNDNDSDLADALTIQRNYTGPLSVTGVAVPEPTAGVAALGVVLCRLSRRNQRRL